MTPLSFNNNNKNWRNLLFYTLSWTKASIALSTATFVIADNKANVNAILV